MMTRLSRPLYAVRGVLPCASGVSGLVVCCVVAVVAPPARAAVISWDGGGVNSEWIEPANWNPNTIPSTADTARIAGDTAMITGAIVPPVQATEIGFGLASGGLVIAGGVNPAGLNVVTNVTVTGGGNLTLGGGGPADSQLNAGSLVTAGTVNVLQRGTIQLVGPFTQSAGTVTLGDATLNAATVATESGLFDATGSITGDVTIGNGDALTATLSPGVGIGDLAINGDLDFMSDGRLELQFTSNSRGDVFDTIAVSGAVTLGGTLDLSVIGSGLPTPGVSYPLLTAKKLIGDFDDIIGAGVGPGSWVPDFNVTNGVNVSYSVLRGDMNADDSVDEDDVELFARALRDEDTYHFDIYLNGFVAEAFMADMDLDGSNTFADIPLFLDAVTQSGGSAAAALAQIASVLSAVPEPPSALLICGMLGLASLSAAKQQRSRGRRR